MPTTRPCPDTGHSDIKKKHTFLGNVFSKLHPSSSSKKTPRKTTVGDQSHGGTVKKLFPFSGGKVKPTPYGDSVGGSKKSRLVGLVASPARLFRTSEDLIPASHGDGNASSIKVVVRVRPKNDKEQKVGVTVCGQESGRGGPDTLVLQSSGPGERQMFSFDTILGQETSQKDVYDVSGKTVVENCLKGFNGCLLAYGQTGSGKTYSMMGEGDWSHRGIIQRSFEELFDAMKEKEAGYQASGGNMEYSVRCSFIEIYNESVSDLTNLGSGSLVIRDDPVRGVFVEGVEWHAVQSMTEIDRILSLGMSNRRVEETMANDRSSRSHSVFTAMIEQKMTNAADNMATILRSQMHLVDLAGSERQKVSGAAGERLKEASNINKSLSALGHVIMSLVDVQQGKQRHVPYRDSKLTFLLQDALGGSAKTVLLATISPASLNAFETLSTLRFADNVKRIKNKSVIHQDARGDTDALQKEVARLRGELDKALQHQAAPTEEEEHGAHKALRAALAREEHVSSRVASLQEEISALQSLADAKEADLQRTKMMLRLKESRITRAQGARGGPENVVATLESEIALLKEKIESHPDVKRFALENIRLRRTIEEYAQSSHVTDVSSMVPVEDLEQLRMQFLMVSSKAEKAEEEVRMLKAEAAVSKEILRTAEKKRESRIPRVQDVSALEAELDDLRVFSNQQAMKISEYEELCAHAGDLDVAAEELTQKCRGLKLERDDWYDAYAVLVKNVVDAWNVESELVERVHTLERILEDETKKHTESYAKAKNKIAEAAKSASLLQEDLEQKSATIATLERTVGEISQARDDLSLQVHEQHERLEILQQKCDEHSSTILQLTHCVESHKHDIDGRDATISTLEDHVNDIQRELEETSNKCHAMEKEQSSLQASLASAQIDAQMAQAQLKEKAKQLAFSEESESELRATIISLQEEISVIRDDAEAKILEMQHELDTSRDTIVDVENELTAYKNKCSMLNGPAMSEYAFKKERAALQARIKELEDARPTIAEEASTTGPLGKEAHVRNMVQKLQDTEDTVTYLKQEVSSLKASIKSRDDTLAKLRNQMATEVNDAAQQVQELLAAQARADALEKELCALKQSTM